jgi:hypothetical protein
VRETLDLRRHRPDVTGRWIHAEPGGRWHEGQK